MVRYACEFMLVICLLLSCAHTQTQTLAFPTAEGFGRFARGGRGGRPIFVTNLERGNTVPGSFGACLSATGPRVCIFRVGGIIDWPCQANVGIPGCIDIPPYLTIAGQTAPGDGIMIKGMELQFRDTHDIIVRHLRVRPGKRIPVPQSGGAIEMYGASTPTHDVIIDHYSAGWAPDDTLVGWNAYNITYQWGILSEGLGNSGSDPSKCAQWVPYDAGTKAVSFLHNLWANHNARCPALASGDVQIVNNVFYNLYAGSGLHPAASGTSGRAEFVGNYYKPGPGSQPDVGTAIDLLGCGYDPYVDCASAANFPSFYLGNFHTTLRPDTSFPETSLVFQRGNLDMPISATPFGFPDIPTLRTATEALTEVLAKAGARAPVLDSIDQRAVNDVQHGTGRKDLLDEDVVGGYPTYNTGTPYPDTDEDGMSDAWESAHGLNPHDPSDGPRLASNGYTNLENFLNELAGDTLSGSLPRPTNLRLISVSQ